MRPLFAAGLGGRLGRGEQWTAWIGIDDLVDVYYRAVLDPELSGPVNAVAPHPVRNREYTRHPGPGPAPARPWCPSPSLAPRLLLGAQGAAELAEASQRVQPERLLAAGHPFRYPVPGAGPAARARAVSNRLMGPPDPGSLDGQPVRRLATAGMRFEKGLHEVADGVWAYLQPDGGWGWSNAGLITDGTASLLVDTLFDLELTAEMLADMRRVRPGRRSGGQPGQHPRQRRPLLRQLAGGRRRDHRLAPMRPGDGRAAAVTAGRSGASRARRWGVGPVRAAHLRPFYLRRRSSWPRRPGPSRGSWSCGVGDRRVRLLEVGPAHTAGDVVVHLPDDGVVFTGDILFHGGHPIVWAGPVGNWIAACDRLLGLGADTVVPGHGPLATPGAVRDLKEYFEYLTVEARQRFDAGLTPLDAARDIDLGPYAGWGDAERVVGQHPRPLPRIRGRGAERHPDPVRGDGGPGRLTVRAPAGAAGRRGGGWRRTGGAAGAPIPFLLHGPLQVGTFCSTKGTSGPVRASFASGKDPAARPQQMRGNGSPTSMSTIRVPPKAVTSTTRPGGSPRT